MQITLFQADCLYQPANCQYPHKMVITSKTDMAKLQSRDHVCAEYKNNYRSNNNFIVSDNIPMDCDNEHTENQDEWITEEKLDAIFPDVGYILVFSRNHMKSKDRKAAR